MSDWQDTQESMPSLSTLNLSWEIPSKIFLKINTSLFKNLSNEIFSFFVYSKITAINNCHVEQSVYSSLKKRTCCLFIFLSYGLSIFILQCFQLCNFPYPMTVTSLSVILTLSSQFLWHVKLHVVSMYLGFHHINCVNRKQEETDGVKF